MSDSIERTFFCGGSRQLSASPAPFSAVKWMKHFRVACAVLLSVFSFGLLAGCEGGGGGSDDDDDDAAGDGVDVVGTWSLNRPGRTIYIVFGEDGAYEICENADGSERIVYGTYTVSGNTVSGPMTNPGVGSGDILAIIEGDTIMLDFTEYWHTPHKVVEYSGERL
jgi:hypothetical protein